MSLITTEVRGRAGLITLNDPDKRNAITLAMNDEIGSALDAWEADEGIGAVVLTGAGRGLRWCRSRRPDGRLERGRDEGDLRRIPPYRSHTAAHHRRRERRSRRCRHEHGAGVRSRPRRARVRQVRFSLPADRYPSGWRTHVAPAPDRRTFHDDGDGDVQPDPPRRAGERGRPAWEVIDDADLVDTAVEMAAVAAGQDRELNARTKATILTLDTITESNQAVDYEIHPQLWSMGQPPFMELVTRLMKDISSKC